jgi:hypothetical protein
MNGLEIVKFSQPANKRAFDEVIRMIETIQYS